MRAWNEATTIVGCFEIKTGKQIEPRALGLSFAIAMPGANTSRGEREERGGGK